MRVAYDISILGMGEADPEYRTGIFRVAEQVALGLAASGACELSFTSTLSLRALDGALRYLDSRPELRGASLAASPAGSALARALLAAEDRLPRARGAGRLPLAAARRVLWAGQWLVKRGFGSPGGRIPPGTDVFHSPLFALPPRGRGSRRTQRFLTVHDLTTVRFPETFERGIVESLERIFRSLRPDDWVLAVSECTRADLCQHRPDLDPARVFVTPLAADPRLFHPVADPERIAAVRARYGIPEGPYLLSLNSLNPRKNMERAIRAFARLVAQERLRDLSFVLVGPWAWKPEHITRALEGTGAVRERIVLPGYVPDEDLAPLYGGALAFLYPSLYEGFGLPPLEAMQCGTPVVASSTSSLPEVVGDAGVLVDPADEDALCQAMWRLYHDAALRERLAAASLARASRFSWERCVGQTLAAYRTALAA